LILFDFLFLYEEKILLDLQINATISSQSKNNNHRFMEQLYFMQTSIFQRFDVRIILLMK